MKQKITLSLLAFFIAILGVSAQTLVAHYKFDGNLNDETGTYNLSEVGFTAGYETGQDATPNGAVNGFGDKGANYLESSVLFEIFGSTSRTMAAWAKLDQTAHENNGFRGIVGLGEPSTGKKWTFGIQKGNNDADGNELRAEVAGDAVKTDENPAFAPNTWYHVAVVYDDATKLVKLYINGVFIISDDWTTANVNTTQTNLRVGNDYNLEPANRGFGGALDDLQIYSGAADDTFILNLYNSTKLAVNKLTLETFNAYPNPVKNRLHFSTNKIASVDIYNILGSKLASMKVLNDGVDMSGFSKGVYLVKCNDAEGLNIATIKTVKE